MRVNDDGVVLVSDVSCGNVCGIGGGFTSLRAGVQTGSSGAGPGAAADASA